MVRTEHMDTRNNNDVIILTVSLQERLITAIREKLPQKSFGYFLSDGDSRAPTDFLLLDTNVRNTDAWKRRFESYGPYFVDHDDAGFVATPEETWRAQKQIWERDALEVGIFHSHLRHPGNFSRIDYEMHMQRFPDLWHMIISMRNPDLPQLRAFEVSGSGVRELEVMGSTRAESGEFSICSNTVEGLCDTPIAQLRPFLELDHEGRPRCKDSQMVFLAVHALLLTGNADAIQEVLIEGFLKGSDQRFEEHIAAGMSFVRGGRYEMGTDIAGARHFCGESPLHTVELSPFRMAKMQVTNELFGIFDGRKVRVYERHLPAVNITWFEAYVFALWMGCRLPTEAEWEFAAGAGSEGQWCCWDEGLLPRYAWYSDNAGGQAHPVGTREANCLGLFDLHGNVWEWCRDTYNQDYYRCAPAVNPLSTGSPLSSKVCRGGSMHSLAEMCRTRYRFHEPPVFMASDLGFRLAK